jgi:ribonuclease P protein component
VQRKFRLTRSTDFQRVRRLGKSYAHPLLVLLVLAAEADAAETVVGIAAGRTLGNAVRRNRAKRRLRAAVQPYLLHLPPGRQLVLIGRAPLAEASYAQLDGAVATLLRRAHLLAPAEERVHA